MLPSRAAIALLLLALSATGQGTQAPPNPVPVPSLPTLRITVTLVQVDAVVTDSSGRHIAGLSPDDFELLQDGEPQKITHFSYVPEAAPLPVPPAPLGPPQPITPHQVRRAVALVVDDMALSFSNLVRVREALRVYIEQQMQPGDLVAIVRTGGGLAILEQFTTDKRLLLEAVSLLKWRFSGRSGFLPINPDPTATPAARPKGTPEMLDYGYTLSALGALGTIEEVVRGMTRLPGRKSLVLFSDSLRMDTEITSAIDRITDLANRAAVSFYTIDPTGLKTRDHTSGQGVQVAPMDPQAPRPFPPFFGADQDPDDYRWQEGLSYLATRTGGLFFHDRNDIPDCIRQATEDQLGYYLLAYTPRAGTFESTSGKAKFHRVKLLLHRPGLQVRWKSGFNGVSDEPLESTSSQPMTRERQILEALASPFTATGVKVRLTSMFAVNAAGPVVHSMLQFGARELTFHQDSQGTWHASVDIVTSAYRGAKQLISQRQRVQAIELPDELYQKSLKEGFLFQIVDAMKEPGMFLMRAVVRDRESARIGSASQFVQVPDIRKGQLALSGIVIQLATPEMLKKVGLAARQQDGRAEEWAEGGPAVRRYRAGQSIVYGYQVMNPKLPGPGKEPRVLTQVRVYRNGKLLHAGQPGRSVTRSESQPTMFRGAGMLRLGGSAGPGEYLLQVLITDEFAKKKRSRIAQWIDFEVIDEAAPATASVNSGQ